MSIWAKFLKMNSLKKKLMKFKFHKILFPNNSHLQDHVNYKLVATLSVVPRNVFIIHALQEGLCCFCLKQNEMEAGRPHETECACTEVCATIYSSCPLRHLALDWHSNNLQSIKSWPSAQQDSQDNLLP